MKKIINCETGEETLISLSEEDLAQQAIDEANIIEAQILIKAEAQAKAAKRVELLSKLGITEEEARILLG